MTAPHSPHSDHEDTRPKIDLKLTQVAAAALAAVTAAVAGATLGTAGTMAGAAAASVIFTVTSAVYRASLEHSRTKVRALAQRRGRASGSADSADTGQVPLADLTGPAGDQTRAGTGSRPGDEVGDSAEHRPRPWRNVRRLRWGAVVVGSLSAFLLAMLAITGFEVASGQTISGKSGTTLQHAVNRPPGPQTPEPSVAPPSESRSPTPSETTGPTESTGPSSTAPTTPEGTGDKRNPSATSTRPTPSPVRPTPPLLPTRLPGPGDREEPG